MVCKIMDSIIKFQEQLLEFEYMMKMADCNKKDAKYSNLLKESNFSATMPNKSCKEQNIDHMRIVSTW